MVKIATDFRYGDRVRVISRHMIVNAGGDRFAALAAAPLGATGRVTHFPNDDLENVYVEWDGTEGRSAFIAPECLEWLPEPADDEQEDDGGIPDFFLYYGAATALLNETRAIYSAKDVLTLAETLVASDDISADYLRSLQDQN